MAKAYVAEYSALVLAPNGHQPPVCLEPPVAEQVVDFTSGVAATANPLNASTRYVRVNVDSTCSFLFGAGAPVATAANKRLAQDSTEYFGVAPGATTKISFIPNS